jgi:deoxyribonuclease IV
VILGAHVRRRGAGVQGAVEECRIRGAECAQVFLSNPRAWAPPASAPDEAGAFREAWSASGLGPLAAHAPYVVNVASTNPGFLRRSRELAVATVREAERVGVDLVVVHSGTGGADEPEAARRRAAASFREVVGAAARTRVAVELMAGTSGAVASTIDEARTLLDAVGDERLGLCLDTCHLFATGYALDDQEGVEGLVDELQRTGLLERVALVHANDSAYGRGEHRDRHAYLDEGRIGAGGWRPLVRSPLAAVAWVTETAGDADRQRADLAMLRALASPDAGSARP